MPHREQPELPGLSIAIVSDSTGETATAMVRAALGQFAQTAPRIKIYPFILSGSDLVKLDPIWRGGADVLVYTVVDPDLAARLGDLAARAGIPSVPVLEPLVTALAALLGNPVAGRPGKQHTVDTAYLDRISALDYAIGHDDGQSEDHLLAAEVILAGVSRTSKTPTCIYLAYQSVKAANVPLILGQPEPKALLVAMAAGVPVIGLTASPSRLTQVRKTRLTALGQPAHTAYTDPETLEEELVFARLFFEKYNLPVIDVTRRSIEETAASIRHILEERRP